MEWFKDYFNKLFGLGNLFRRALLTFGDYTMSSRNFSRSAKMSFIPSDGWDKYIVSSNTEHLTQLLYTISKSNSNLKSSLQERINSYENSSDWRYPLIKFEHLLDKSREQNYTKSDLIIFLTQNKNDTTYTPVPWYSAILCQKLILDKGFSLLENETLDCLSTLDKRLYEELVFLRQSSCEDVLISDGETIRIMSEKQIPSPRWSNKWIFRDYITKCSDPIRSHKLNPSNSTAEELRFILDLY